MRRSHRFTTLLGAALGAAALIPTSAASADGLPLPVEETGPTGIADPGGAYRYVSLDVGRDTLVERTVQNGGQVSGSRILEGTFTIPAVALDGSPGGLSGDGETLALIRPRPRPGLPRETTELVALDTERLKVRDVIRLDGDFSFDAISADGRWLYLIEYVAPRDLTRYQVRRYDLERNRLEPGAIIDPEAAEEVMAGYPLARATSPDGRWVYTLYSNYGRDFVPFIHALDTKRGTAVCIDLPALDGVRDLNALGLDPDPSGTGLAVTRRGDPGALVDSETFEVSQPPDPRAAPEAEGDGGGGPIGWIAVGAGALILVAVGALVRRRNGEASADSTTEDELARLMATGERVGEPEGTRERELVP
ncbi:MAG: hypothetical protein ACRDK9_02740 [Solirubrobacterales bacterium]